MNSMQITDIVMPYQFLICTLFAYFEVTASGEFKQALVAGGSGLFKAIAFTCFAAIAVNLVTFALIGKTSAVTYQVVGHLKTCLTLLGGYIMFDSKAAALSIYNVAGVIIALIGMMLYGDIKSSPSSKENILMRLVPKFSLWKKEF